MKDTILKPVKDEPALLIVGEGRRILCIADLHLGIEDEFREKGINIAPQSSRLAKLILNIAGKVNAAELLILGDLKHNIPFSTLLEAIHIPEFLKELSGRLKITVIPGNHDTGLKKMLPSYIRLERSTGLVVDFKNTRIGFVHGHSKPAAQVLNSDILVVAHTHPAVRLVDKLYKRFTEPVWIITQFISKNLKNLINDKNFVYERETTKLIIIPAFNPLITGSPVNVNKRRPLLGPVLQSQFIDMENAEIHLLDGTYLGKLSELPKFD
ncbi:MAG: metallophosphoesterase [Candidatus Odinarchaeum yellowstonii]|uniref:Metallophosphoesterase n=1 Tax=Odinarchaeota yellowstonii (strain LCB_4) TaxID=1841599 RepID=A0AAF0D1F5_ODILC|nr:MAG: metallophosphoesterase [Candidatus Odinarchaeum yellowstonii]